MRGDPAAHRLVRAASLQQALDLLAEKGWHPLAGGTDVMVLFAAGMLTWRQLVDIRSLPDLHGISVAADQVTLGALTTYTEVQRDQVLQSEFPMLCQAASVTGGWAIQNRGTLGGNIANGSPAADSPPALLAYGAEIELLSARGARWLPYHEFHTGYRQSVMAEDELIRALRLPRRRRPAQLYRKVGPRRAQAISKICFAGASDETGSRIALGGVAPIVLRCPRAEAALDGGDLEGARAALADEIAPIDDLRSTARYRRRVALNLLDAFADRVAREKGARFRR